MTPSRDIPLMVRTGRPVLLLAAAAAVAALTACGSSGSGSGSAGAGGGYSSSPAATPASHAAAGAKQTVRVETHSGPLGTYLTDGSGRTLYMFAADGRSASHCMGSCATYWPPLTTKGAPAAAGSAKAADLGTIARSGGTRQVTYAGHPLYYYIGDHQAGDTSGQGSTGSGAKWWVLAPSGKPITGSSSGGSKASSSSSSGSGGGGGAWG